ncbi:benzoate 4-monooxygenase cytochrome P450 [Xylaria venustula]|nr:benzoate 4-monooxygenase cytochrome P450 [Xylaria venustula]
MDFFGLGSTLARSVALLIVAYYLAILGYRILFHRLSQYPGPFIAKFADSYGGFYSLKRDLHLRTWRDHKQYGNVIRQGPNKLVFNSIAAVHDIYLNDKVSKSLCYEAGNFNPATTNVFNTIDKRVHRIKRQHVGRISTESSIRTFESKLSQQVNVFMRQLLSSCQEDTGSAVNMSQRCRYLGLDIAGYLGFGYALNLQTDSTYRYLVDAMMIASWRLNMYMQFPVLRKLRLEIIFYLLAVFKEQSVLQTLSKMIRSRLAKDKHAEHDLYSFMADSLETPQEDRITASEIWTEGIFFFPAAGDTASTTLCALFFYLSRNPECQRKLAFEIRTTFTSGADIGGPRLAGCQYLRACINESLRMSPPVPGTLWREKLPSDGNQPLIVDGHVIPSGTQVGVNIYTLHHNPEYFPDPFAYMPARWLRSSTEHAKPTISESTRPSDLIHHPAFIPFSLGARGCAGKALAYAEVSLAMARALWYFDFELSSTKSMENKEVEFRLFDVFTSTHDGPYLNFTARGEYYKELLKDGEEV